MDKREMVNVYDKRIMVTSGNITGILFEISDDEAVIEFDHDTIVGYPVKKVFLASDPEKNIADYFKETSK